MRLTARTLLSPSREGTILPPVTAERTPGSEALAWPAPNESCWSSRCLVVASSWGARGRALVLAARNLMADGIFGRGRAAYPDRVPHGLGATHDDESRKQRLGRPAGGYEVVRRRPFELRSGIRRSAYL